jgi:excisionase family DNA binding protein
MSGRSNQGNRDLPLTTTSTAAKLLDVTVWTVTRLTKTGVLPCVRDTCGRRLFRRSAVLKLAAQRATAGRHWGRS